MMSLMSPKGLISWSLEDGGERVDEGPGGFTGVETIVDGDGLEIVGLVEI